MIRGGPNAYDGLSDLVRRFCGRPRGLDVRGNTTAIELIAPLALRFDRARLARSSERVTIALQAAADVFVPKAQLHWTTGATGEPFHHGSAKLDDRDWTREGETLYWNFEIPSREGDATATLFILVGDRCVDCVSVPLTDSNPRMRAHNALDPAGHEFVEKLRDEEWRHGREFEVAVGLLFFFLGFQVDPLCAQKGLGNAVDHLAHEPASSVILAIECTVGPLDGAGKLGKLIARAESMRSALPESEVIAVLATARPRAELSKIEVAKAGHDDVVLLAQEDLHNLWTTAHAGTTSPQVVRQLRTRLLQSGPESA